VVSLYDGFSKIASTFFEKIEFFSEIKRPEWSKCSNPLTFSQGYIRKQANSFSKKAGAPKAAQKSKDEKSLKILDFSA